MLTVQLFLLLLRLACPILAFVFQEGVCKQKCDEKRQGIHFDRAFTFDCYQKTNEDESCLKLCEMCPSQVCDEYERGLSSNFFEFHCPPYQFKGKCMDRCEANRPGGNRFEYSFYCDEDVSPDKKDCYTCDNGDCANFICSTQYTHTSYRCPSAYSFGGVCEERCDKHRQPEVLGPYDFSCGNLPGSEANTCRDECSQCPQWVCNSRDSPSLYKCPATNLTRFPECLDLCNKHRPNVYRDFKFVCEEHYSQSVCDSYCKSCPNYICDQTKSSHTIHCPKEEPRLYPSENKRRYKGKCKDRCEKSRAGGFHDFRLNCTSRFNTVQEQDHCLMDCNLECPEDVCYNNDTISCKEDHQEAKKFREEREDFKRMLRQEYGEKQDALRNPHRKTMTALYVLLVIVILATVAFVWCTLKKKRVAPEVVNGLTMSMQETRTLRDVSTSDISASSENKQENVQPK